MSAWQLALRTIRACLAGLGRGALLGVLACAPPPPAPKKPPGPVASATPPKLGQRWLMAGAEPSLPELRTGRIQPIDHGEPLLLKVRRHSYDGEQQVVELVLPEFASELPGDVFWLGTEARLSGRSAPLQLVSTGQESEMVLWLRRPKSEASTELAGDAYTPSLGAQPGHHFRFRAPSPSGTLSPTLAKDWASAAAGYLSRQPGAFGVFASNRLRARYKLMAESRTQLDPLKSHHSAAELALLMDTFTGRSAVQEALAQGRGRIFAAAKQPRTLPIASLKGPSLARHPWAEPRLADELDFRYMLARDASVPAELLGFIGDQFVESAVGPAQKIAQARRQVALAELSAPPFAALLFGWVHGQSPTEKQQLLRSGLLQPDESKHHDGARIEWSPGAAPRSTWGTPAALEPLIDLPTVTKISVAEREGYASFARQYETRWSVYIDPIALRVETSHRGGGSNLHAELRVLPLLPRANAELIDAVGDGQVDPPELASGVRFSLGIGEQSKLRELATRRLSVLASAGGPSLQLDWLGDCAAVGLADRSELALATRKAQELREFPVERPASAEELGRGVAPPESRTAALEGLPLYVVIGLCSRAAAAVALAALRQMAESSAPGVFEWGPFAQHRGMEVVRVSARERGYDVILYYALAADSLIVSLNASVMRTLLDQALDGGLPRQSLKNVDRRKLAQVVLELAPLRKGAVRSVLSWALVASALEGAPTARALAEAVLRGVPESAHDADRSAVLSRNYFGAAPLTPDGRRYRLLPDGVTDPLRGTAHAPEWPKLPTADSPTDRVLSALLRLRSDLSFENEPEISGKGPRLRSLRARVDLRLR